MYFFRSLARESYKISYCEFLFARAPEEIQNLENNLLLSNKYPKKKTVRTNDHDDDDENLLRIIKTYYPGDKIYVASFALLHDAEKIYGFRVISRHFRFNV